MATIKHVIGHTEVATITQVLRERNVAERLDLRVDNNYTGTAIYQYVVKQFPITKALHIEGPIAFHKKADLVNVVETYMNRKLITPEQKRAIADVIRLVKTQPERAERALAILTK
jgi:predicted transcriptional regulator